MFIFVGFEENVYVDVNIFGGDVVVRVRRVVKLCYVFIFGVMNFLMFGGVFVCVMVDMGFMLEDFECLLLGLLFLFYGILCRCRDFFVNGWLVEVYKFIGC